MRRIGISFAAVLLASVSLLAQQDFSKVEIKSTHVAGNIHMLEGAGGNIGVSTGPDGILIVDDQFAPLAEKIDAALRKLDERPQKFVLNTHWHGDHTGGNAHFGRKASIIAHTNVRKRLAGKSETPKEALPVVTHEDGLSVHFNGEEIRMIALGPGHTDGDSAIHFTKSGVVHMGDQFFNGWFPFIDLGSGGSVEGYMKNVENMLQKTPDDAKIIPGHGPLATKKDLKAFHDMLIETTGIIRKGIAEGKTLEQVKAAGLPEKYKDWGSGFINTSRYIEIVYNNLKAK
ncbi:MAG: MBL fold metallo-hydrolase [Verrucomicrobia subdivision 3 bacterium]|nr:MBL fold metallo-hydrolase [Limisphaerales bacterium]